MAAAYFELLSSDLQKVDSIINKALKIRAGQIGQFAHLEKGPLQKSLHPAMVLLTGRLFNEESEKQIALAAVVQFIYMAAAVHFRIDEEAVENGDVRDGAQLPVLVGDNLYGRFFTTLCAGGIVEYLQPLAEIIAEMNLGGLLRVKHGLPEDGYDAGIIEKETASLMAGCCRLSAKVAGAGEDKVVQAAEFGYNLGMGYGILERELPVELAGPFFDRALAVLEKMPAGEARQILGILVRQLKEGELPVPVKIFGAADGKVPPDGGRSEVPYIIDKEKSDKGIFSNIARKYDTMNTVLRFKRDKYWRRITVEKAALKSGESVLDVCCGTGLLTMELARATGPSGKVVGLDFSEDMLENAKAKLKGSSYENNINYVLGNAMEMPFADDSFDCATIGFGLRNVSEMRRTLQEMMRVIKPGGRLVCLEFAKPTLPGQVYKYFSKCVPLLGKIGIGQEGACRSSHQSGKGFPHQAELKQVFSEVGMEKVRYFELTGGVVAIHIGYKSADRHGHRSVAATKEN